MSDNDAKKPVNNIYVYPTRGKGDIATAVNSGITLWDMYYNTALPSVLKAYLEKSVQGLTPEMLEKHVSSNCAKIADAMLLGREAKLGK